MHFMANAPDAPNGSTEWRNRMLQLRGWQVVSVPAVESRLGGNAEKQRAYLLQRFAQAGVQLRGEREGGTRTHGHPDNPTPLCA